MSATTTIDIDALKAKPISINLTLDEFVCVQCALSNRVEKLTEYVNQSEGEERQDWQKRLELATKMSKWLEGRRL